MTITITNKNSVGPTTIKGAFKAFVSLAGLDGSCSLKSFARSVIKAGEVAYAKAVVADAKRWLAVKRPGGSDEQRQERKARRKERQSINAAAKAAKKGKAKLKSSGKKKSHDGE